MDDCIFCKIIKKEIPANIAYEDENFLAFLDIEPVSDGHLLIIPKKHIVWMQEANDEIIAGIFKLAKKLMLAIKNGLKYDYVQVSVGGTDVPHFHVHLIPRYLDDGLTSWPTKKYKGEEGSEIVKKIISAL
ncbi:MAG TPA: HIT family protein [Candidatus Paceibacterota bacterium]|jgi:histidine triad (HIT) family protein|nr:HIT family protein [Candidatus Paceibacterota bacterium]